MGAVLNDNKAASLFTFWSGLKDIIYRSTECITTGQHSLVIQYGLYC